LQRHFQISNKNINDLVLKIELTSEYRPHELDYRHYVLSVLLSILRKINVSRLRMSVYYPDRSTY